MPNLQQTFDVAWGIIENRKPWRCGTRDGCFFIHPTKPHLGCFLGQMAINIGVTDLSEIVLLHIFEDAAKYQDAYRELSDIHDNARSRADARRRLLKFAEKYMLGIPVGSYEVRPSDRHALRESTV